MSKRRVFDIDFDVAAETAPAPDPDPGEPRRGPMAAAITENAAALTERQAAEAAIRAENDRLAHEYVALKRDGAIVARVPLEEIRADKLVRDRSASRDPELDELKASIEAVGLSNPIQVEDTGDGYELIQGFRRLSAFRELDAEAGDDRFARIPATLVAKGAQIEVLYRRMVDENLVRRDISFAEMAQLALSYSQTTGTALNDAVDRLYASAGRQKRSYIRHFVHLMQAIGAELKYPEAIPRALGLRLLKALDTDPRLKGQVVAVLRSQPRHDADAELAILTAALERPRGDNKDKTPAPRATSKTTIKLNRPSGPAKVTAAQGKVELQMDRNFGSVDPRKLELAVRAFLEQIGL